MGAMPKLTLHVGHSKTGSSALQSMLALNKGRLAEQGCIYPDHPSFAEAQRGNISSGNLIPARLVEWYDAARRANPDAAQVLFSTELAMFHFLNDPAPIATLTARGVVVEIILFIRDPVEHALSSYVQQVKRGGLDGPLGAYLAGYAMPVQVARFLAAVTPIGAELIVHNYSIHRDRLEALFLDAIGHAGSGLTPLPFQQVNRSLTGSEVYLQRQFNRLWGQKSSVFISDALCNDAPEIVTELPMPARADYDAMLARLSPAIAQVSAQVPAPEAYRITPYDQLTTSSQPDDQLEFAPGQIDALAAAISARIPRPDLVERFSALALKARAGHALTRAEVALMVETALAMDPVQGRLIHKQSVLAAPRPPLIARLRNRLKRLRR